MSSFCGYALLELQKILVAIVRTRSCDCLVKENGKICAQKVEGKIILSFLLEMSQFVKYEVKKGETANTRKQH
jgi:hypothetical protein